MSAVKAAVPDIYEHITATTVVYEKVDEADRRNSFIFISIASEKALIEGDGVEIKIGPKKNGSMYVFFDAVRLPTTVHTSSRKFTYLHYNLSP